jgi:hypothetical protein
MLVGAAQLLDDDAVRDKQDPIGGRRSARVVRDHHERLTVVLHRAAEQVEDLATRLRIEIPGRLVGENHAGPAHQRPCDRDPLLLTARELRGPMLAAVLETDLPEQVVEEPGLRLPAPEGQRQDDVLLRSQHRQQVEELEDEADVLPAQLRDLGVAEIADPCSRNRHVALSWLVERRKEVHQRRFPGARGTHDRSQHPTLDTERDAAQRVHGRVTLAVDTAQFVRLDHRPVSSPGAISRHREVGHRGPGYTTRPGLHDCRDAAARECHARRRERAAPRLPKRALFVSANR